MAEAHTSPAGGAAKDIGDCDADRLEMQRALSHRRHSPESFNVMVAGRSGVGKSTLLQTLCDSFYSLKIESLYQGDCALFESTDPSNPPRAEEVLDPFCVFDTLSATQSIRRCVVETPDLEHHRPIRIELIDTPGIDSFDEAKAGSTINALAWEIERRLLATLEDEVKTRRGKSLHSSHIHAVVYVIPPPVCSTFVSDSPSHRPDTAMDILTDTDILAIKQLGRFANVILAVGKSDTIGKSEWKLIKDGRFFSEVHELIEPVKLYSFSDVENTLKESRRLVSAFQKQLIPRLPFFVCGSMHVDEWQQMRLPEYQTSSHSHVAVQDWRVLSSEHNRVCAPSGIITKGIFSERRQSLRPDSPSRSHAHVEPQTKANESLISVHSMRTHSDSVFIKRLQQRREVFLVREFGWGQLQLNNPDHCDFALLVAVVFHSFRQSLEIWTDKVHYETFRMQRMSVDARYREHSRDVGVYFTHERALKEVPRPSRRNVEPLRIGAATTMQAMSASQAQTGKRDRTKTASRGKDTAQILGLSTSLVSDAPAPAGVQSLSLASGKSGSDGTATPQFAFQIPLASNSGQSPTGTAVAEQSRREDPFRSSHRVSGATTLATLASICSPHSGPSKRESASGASRRESTKPARLQRNRRYTISASTEAAAFA